MGSWNAIYLRGTVPDDFRAPIEGSLPIRSLGPWTELALPGVDDGEPTALALSSQVRGELVWVLVQTTASVLSVVRYEDGRVTRRTEYADGSWRRVEGTPHAWEDALFSDEALDEALEDDDESAVRSTFAAKKLSAGAALPRPHEWQAMLAALGVSDAEWKATRNAEPTRVLVGRATSRVTVVARLCLAGGVLSIAAGIATHGDARALSVALGVPLLLLGLGAAALRRANLGRWLF